MTKRLVVFLGCWIGLIVSVSAQDTHLTRVADIKQSFAANALKVTTDADEIDLGLQRFGWKSKSTNEARMVATNLVNTLAWKDLISRETKRNRNAVAEVKRQLDHANQLIASGRRELAIFEKAEYDAWARVHPEEANALAMEKRLKTAESAAANAQSQAQDAERAANQAKRDAEQARMEAQNEQERANAALRHAQQSARKTERAEDTLRQHGISAW